MGLFRKSGHAHLMVSAAVGALTLGANAAWAQSKPINIEPQTLISALHDFGAQTGRQVFYTPELTEAKVSPGVAGATDEQIALAQILQGTGLTFRRDANAFIIERQREGAGPQGGGAGAGNAVQALIVTAQKREEDIQDVPIAISAFSQEDLTRSQVAGGPDLMTQVPNMTFTKTNFSSYSIQLRGIGTQAISATTDPAVAVAFNNTPFVRNHFFEQEFYDLERVEVLRGPQGTLYGRNATAGVVNVISAKPKFIYEAKAAVDIANYKSTRIEGMVNVPLVEDMVALRLAGAWTKRDGFVTNEVTGNPIDGRDLWSTRLSLRFTPTDAIDANLIWEHFQEDDDRLRSGKQLCKTDEVTEFAGLPTTHDQRLPEYGQSSLFAGVQGSFSQGCAPSSLYSPDSFETPNGIALPYYLPLSAVFLPAALDDPYESRGQSHDLRVIESTVDPGYKAKGDVFELQISIDLSDTLSLSSETAWASDFIFSTQDFNRFSTASGAWELSTDRAGVLDHLSAAGYPEFCDPQVGCADRLVAVDLSMARSTQFSQEFRLASDFDGPFNFSVGGNFIRYDTVDKYYVFINSLSIISSIAPYGYIGDMSPYVGGETNNLDCMAWGARLPDPNDGQPILRCTYIDPNPIGSLDDLGHNYFLSKNPYKLISYAAFGEVYYNLADSLKVTAGLRWTVDNKEAPLIPSWVLASNTVGYPVAEVVEQEWREPTGRLAIDWKPDLSFTDETLIYASFAHGYKAGGANPPTYGKAIYHSAEIADLLINESVTHPKTFDPEFVNAYELGAKNTLLDGRMTLNLAGFYYDYEGYQISQIVDRSATNMNFDAKVWGLELEADWRPIENLRLGLKLGYENTKVADGERAVDIMDRTGGNEAWTVYRPFPSIPSNCVLPKWLFIGKDTTNPQLINVGGKGGGNPGGCELAYLLGYDPATGDPYTLNPYAQPGPQSGEGLRTGINYADWSTDPAMYPGWPTGVPITNGKTYPGWDPTVDYGNNHGEGFYKDLSGNELPNAPNLTATITADYTIPLPNDWLATLHTDLYYQSEAWTRIFNTEGYDKLKAYTNINVAAIFTNEVQGWKVMAYVKNVMDRDSITGAFLNSDDTGLTTNVFLTEPRLYGVRITKEWNGGPWWTGAGLDHPAGEPYPLTIEIGGQIQRVDAPYESLEPSFAGAFSPGLDIFTDPQHQDLDTGDDRQLKLTYRPAGGAWQVSAGLRYGRTNGAGPRPHAEEETDDKACAFGGPYEYLCPIYLAYYQAYAPEQIAELYKGATNWSDAWAKGREEHKFVDFAIGRDVGMGGLDRSVLNAGVRYAEFRSTTYAESDGVPSWQLVNGFFLPGYLETHTRYVGHLQAERKFEGTGPVVSWDASARLLGDDATGHLALDWSLGGGVLFGKQTTSIAGHEEERRYEATGPTWYTPRLPVQTIPSDIAVSRSKSISVPTVAASLGLSYSVSRISIGAGYRWERYFDVIDGGFASEQSENRTLDGPYFKLAIGFGG